MLKNLLQSPRPPHKIIWVNKNNPELDPGFPSTHTMTAFTIPWYLIVFYWDVISPSTKITGIAMLLWWSFSIAISRIYNGHHFIVDVVGGFSLAMGILGMWTHYLRPIVDSVMLTPSFFCMYCMLPMLQWCGVFHDLLYLHSSRSYGYCSRCDIIIVYSSSSRFT